MSNPSEPLADNANSWLDGLFDRMDLDAQVEIDETDEYLRINIVGADADAFTGEGAVHLNSLRGILQYALFPNTRPYKKLTLDAAGYRSRRGDQLQGFSEWLAEKASDLGKPITVVGMNSVDRRAVHLALESDKSLKTESEGVGPIRRLKLTSR